MALDWKSLLGKDFDRFRVNALSPARHSTAMAYKSWLDENLRKLESFLARPELVTAIRNVLTQIKGGEDFMRVLDAAVSKSRQEKTRVLAAQNKSLEERARVLAAFRGQPQVLEPRRDPRAEARKRYEEEWAERKKGFLEPFVRGGKRDLTTDAGAREKLEEDLYVGMKKDPKLRKVLEDYLRGKGGLAGEPHILKPIVKEALRRDERDRSLVEKLEDRTFKKKTMANLPRSGNITLPFGNPEVKGKTLEQIATEKPYYIAYLHGIREKFSGSVFGSYLDLFFEQPWVKTIIRDYTEERGVSNPADLRPYVNPYDPKTWNSDLYWKEWDREGFAASDPWERQLYGRSGTGRGRRATRSSDLNQGLYNVRGDLIVGRNSAQWYGPRRGDYRFSEEYDPEYYQSVWLQEQMRVLGSQGRAEWRRAQKLLGLKQEETVRVYDDRKGRWVEKKRMVETPLARVLGDTRKYPQAIRRYDEESREWVEDVQYQQRFGFLRWQMNQAVRELSKGEGIPGRGEVERYLEQEAKFERAQREFNKIFGVGDFEAWEAEQLGYPYARKKKLKGGDWMEQEEVFRLGDRGEGSVELTGMGMTVEDVEREPPYSQRILEAENVTRLREIAEEIEDKYGLANLRQMSGEEESSIDQMLKERLDVLVRQRGAGLAGGN